MWMSRKVPECDVNTRDECGDTKLVWAACEGQLEEVRRLVGRGAELNIRNRAANKPSAKLSQSPEYWGRSRDCENFADESFASSNKEQ